MIKIELVCEMKNKSMWTENWLMEQVPRVCDFMKSKNGQTVVQVHQVIWTGENAVQIIARTPNADFAFG